MIKKQNEIDISMFLISSGIIIFLLASYFFLQKNLNEERIAIEKEAELQELSFKLADASDYLTSEVRKFAVTLNPKHLRNYWEEINVTKTRENVINRLKDLETPQNEFDLLNIAKNNSDDLVNTETRAMKLLLKVYEVPEDQMEPTIKDYQLTYDDENLSFNDKVNLAREILYDQDYEENKLKILTPIKDFQEKMITRIHNETVECRRKTNTSRNILLFGIFIVSVYLIYLAWFMLFRITVPLKNYIFSLNDDDIDSNSQLQSSKAIELIKNITASINRNT